MNAAHWHLVLNHIPVLGTFFAAGLLVAGIFGSSPPIRQSGLIFLIISALAVIPTVITGEGAEHIVEEEGLSHEIVHKHEEKAEVAQWLMLALGAFALGSIVAENQKARIAKGLVFICLLASVSIGIIMIDVATSGGQIRHPEIHVLSPD